MDTVHIDTTTTINEGDDGDGHNNNELRLLTVASLTEWSTRSQSRPVEKSSYGNVRMWCPGNRW